MCAFWFRKAWKLAADMPEKNSFWFCLLAAIIIPSLSEVQISRLESRIYIDLDLDGSCQKKTKKKKTILLDILLN